MELFDYEKKHLQALRGQLAECAVLLKKDGSFPLAAPGKLAAFGSGVRGTVKGGTGSGEVNSRYFVTVEQGLREAGFTLTTDPWLDAYDRLREEARKAFLTKLRAEARGKKTNVIVYAMGKVMPEPEYMLPLEGEGDGAIYVLSRNSGEGNDRQPVAGDLLLTQTETRDILALNEKFRRFMLVINAGGPVDLSPVAEVKNILVLSQLGVETGHALADILLGRQNPSGKLATTWADWGEYFPMEDFGDPNDTRYREGVYVGYRYFDALGKGPRYPFGFGLSYTSFALAEPRVRVLEDRVTVTVEVTNTGAHPGKEVVQVYVSAPQGRLDKPWQDLAAFEKTPLLAPGETREVTLRFCLKELASFDPEACAWVLEKGNYLIRVGVSSRDTRPAALGVLTRDVTVTQCRPLEGGADFADWKPQALPATNVDSRVPVLVFDPQALEGERIDYEPEEPVDPQVEALSDEELIYASIGRFSGSLSIIGAAGKTVPGAAGETTDRVPGLPVLVMADGPAGLRLTQRFYRDKKGVHSLGGGGLPETMTELLPGFLRWGLKALTGKAKAPEGARVEYQYATAIPIGTALAQSWNRELARLCGDIVGAEMERFGVHLWLAPALNLHRSILCGRNFEYFSEDPVISGQMAGALTQGVQAHPGCGVTVKHYCANNQETNRYGNNSRLSQRALREMYLKGFGICVREAQPKAVMTSYNLLGGIHTAQRRDLIRDTLRCEFGFRGIVMTDWVVGGGLMNSREDIHPAVEPWAVAGAGGELFMPGCAADFRNIRQGLSRGDLSRKQLQINVTRLLRLAKELTEK